jgi:hypothetical protein
MRESARSRTGRVMLMSAIIVGDNMLRPGGEEVARDGRAVRAKPDITSILLPVGSGIEISRFSPVNWRDIEAQG